MQAIHKSNEYVDSFYSHKPMLQQSHQERSRQVILGLSLLFNSVMTYGCAISQNPERPRYTGNDTVDRAHPTQLVGIWEVAELNPFENQPPSTSTINYRVNGIVSGKMTLASERSGAPSDMEFELTGTWALENDVVLHNDIQLRSTDDSTIGALLSDVVNQQKNLSGRANIYELSDNRMVMVGSDGRAMEYSRR